MALDPRIILQGQGFQAPDMLGMAQKAMTMKDLALQSQVRQQEIAKQKTLQDIYKNSTITNPDGTVSIDQKKLGGALTLAGLYPEANALFEQQYTRDAAAAKSSNEQNRWQSEFDLKQQQQALQADKTRAEIAKLRKESAIVGPGIKLSEGQKAVDKDFAKDYNEWTSGGSKSARSEIEKLEGVIGNLKEGKVTTGGLTGFWPDRMTSDSVLGARSDVQSTVMNSLRAILGAAFTEKEGERVIRNTWNEADTTANNISRLNRLVENLKAQADDKDQKVGFYEQNSGSLSGFQAGPSKAPMNDQNIATYATKHGLTYAKAAEILKGRGYGQ